MEAADFFDGGGLGGHNFGEAFQFNQQDGAAVPRKTCVNEIFHGAQRPAVEHFAGRGSDRARGDVRDGFRSVVHGIENGQQGFDALRFAQQLHGNFGNQCERAFRTNHQAGEIVAERIAVARAHAANFSIGQNQFQRGDVIAGHSVRQRVRAAGIF